MGNDVDGNYFLFFDGGTSDKITGTSQQNRLYYNISTGKIEGLGRTTDRYGNRRNYTMTMIRKSKTN
jgi:hypothetical protein